MRRTYTKSKDTVFVTDITKPSRIDRRYDHNFTHTVQKNYSTITTYKAFHNTSFIPTELWRDTVHLVSNCSIFPHSVIYAGKNLKL